RQTTRHSASLTPKLGNAVSQLPKELENWFLDQNRPRSDTSSIRDRDQGVPSDLCWSDPTELIKGYDFSPRGAGCLFGREALDDFLARHELEMIVRAHQVVMDGYEFFGDRKLVTIFSAPSYCGHFDNFGAVMHVNEKLEHFGTKNRFLACLEPGIWSFEVRSTFSGANIIGWLSGEGIREMTTISDHSMGFLGLNGRDGEENEEEDLEKFSRWTHIPPGPIWICTIR
ncbi:Protein CBG18709, partial [Caenorhabditis briggsae]